MHEGIPYRFDRFITFSEGFRLNSLFHHSTENWIEWEDKATGGNNLVRALGRLSLQREKQGASHSGGVCHDNRFPLTSVDVIDLSGSNYLDELTLWLYTVNLSLFTKL